MSFLAHFGVCKTRYFPFAKIWIHYPKITRNKWLSFQSVLKTSKRVSNACAGREKTASARIRLNPWPRPERYLFFLIYKGRTPSGTRPLLRGTSFVIGRVERRLSGLVYPSRISRAERRAQYRGSKEAAKRRRPQYHPLPQGEYLDLADKSTIPL